MRVKRVCSLAVIVTLLVLGVVVQVHVHDTSAPGLYDSQCPLQDATGRVTAASVSAPQQDGVAAAGTALPPPDTVIASAPVSPAPSRGPPLA